MYTGGYITLGVSATLWVWLYLKGLAFGYDDTMWVEICNYMCVSLGANYGLSYCVQGFLHLTMTVDVSLSATVCANMTVYLTICG